MKQITVIVFGILTLVGCYGKNTQNDTIVQNVTGGEYLGEHIVVFNNDSITFFGKTILIDDSVHIMQQIKTIAEEDDLLSIDGQVLTIGEAGFGINLHDDGVVLISSTQVDDPKVKIVVNYLNSLYGTANETEPDNYWWNKEDYNGNTIRLRPLHSLQPKSLLETYIDK